MTKHVSYPTRAQGSVPSFTSYEEEADWWDSHDTGEPDVEEGFSTVQIRTLGGFTRQMMLRLDEETDRELERRAQEQGMKKSTLVRNWVIERLRQDTKRHAS